jgi:rhodanese-related sulfurtransferase
MSTNSLNVKMANLQSYVKKTKNDWNYITPTDFYNNYYLNKSKRNNFVIIDLRKSDAYNEYHIKGAINIFWLDIFKTENLIKLDKLRDKTLFLICYVGHTSSQAMVLLKLLGFKVISIKFGYGISPVVGIPVAGWLQYNYPVVKTKYV